MGWTKSAVNGLSLHFLLLFCTSAAVEKGDEEFLLVHNSLNWVEAGEYCEVLGGTLPCIRDVGQIKEALVMMERTSLSQVYIKGVEVAGFGDKAGACKAGEPSLLKRRGFSPVTNSSLEFPFLCTLPFIKQLPKFLAGEIYVSGEETNNESRDTDCTPLCPRCNHDTDIAASLLGNQQDAAWIGVAKTFRNGSYMCKNGERIDYSPRNWRPMELDLEKARLGVVITNTGEWAYRTTTRETSYIRDLCETTQELGLSLTPSQDVIYGSKTEINCTGHGDHISLKLVRASTNKLLAVGTGNVSVVIANKQENLGDYLCVIKSVVHPDTPMMRTSTTIPAVPHFYSPNTTYLVGDRRSLYHNCSYFGYPRGSLTAKTEGGEEMSLIRGQYTKLGTVPGVYSCSVTRDGYTWVRYSQVTDGKWLQRPGKEVLGGKEIRMTCAVKNVLVFDFFINEVPASTIPGVEVGYDYIYIGNPDNTHVGAVVCQLPGTHHRAFGSINGPPVASLPSQIKGTVGEELTLNCNVNAHPPATITWYTKERQVGTGNILTLRPEYSLNLTHVICDARNSMGHSQAQTQMILRDLEIVNKVDFLDLDEGDDVELKCQAVGMKPITYEWRTKKQRISENKTAILRNVTRNSPEKLTCAACSPLSCQKHTTTLRVRGAPRRLSPPFVGDLNQTHLLIDWEHRDNVTYTFFFLVGQKKPKIWSALTSNETVIKRRKDLAEVRLGVSAQNEYGSSVVSFTWPPFNLFIPAPDNLHPIRVGDTFTEIGWGGTECEEYVVVVANSSTNFTITTAHQPGVEIQTLLVEDLVAWSEYHIVVIPRAGGSSGPSSNTIVVQTLASVIENPVEDLAAEILSISEVYLSWNPPHMVESNGLLEGFQVVKEMLPEEAQIVSQHSNPDRKIFSKRQALQTVRLGYAARSYLARGLTPKRKYKFTIISIASAGSGPPADLSVDTKYDKYVVPGNIKPLWRTAGELELSWEGLPGVDYNVRYWRLGENKQNLTVRNSSRAVVQLPSSSGGTMMWNLQVGKEFKGAVYKYSDVISVNTMIDSAHLLQLRVFPVNEDDVKIVWNFEEGYDPQTAFLSVYPLELAAANLSDELWNDMEKLGHRKVEIKVGDEKSGERTITIPAKMVMYEVKASLSYMGSKLSTTRHWYMKQLLDLPRKLCFKYLLTLVGCGVFLAITWGCLLLRAKLIVMQEAKGPDYKRQVTISTLAS